MVVWALETDFDFTTFYFPLEEDKAYFHDLDEKFFQESKSVWKEWRPLYMLRGEPMKQPDFFEMDGTDILAISQKAVNSLYNLINISIELLPIETDAGRYYALNVLNFVDCLNKEESVFLATKNGIIINYSSLEFDEEKLTDQALFKIPELPYYTFITDKMEYQCTEDDLQGLTFDTKSNLIWYP
jgi:hypothetical protein